MNKNLSSDVKISTALDLLGVAASADRNGAGLDMAGFDAVQMIVKFAEVGADAVTSIKAQQSSDDGSADAYSDLEGTGQTIAHNDDNQIFIIDLVRPTKRYVRVVIDKDAGGATHVTDEMALYAQYAARSLPVTQTVADEVTYELHVSPAEGTA